MVIQTYTYTHICVLCVYMYTGVLFPRTIRGTIGCASFGGRDLGGLYFAFYVFEIAFITFFFNKWGVFISKYYEVTHVKSLEWYYIDIII